MLRRENFMGVQRTALKGRACSLSRGESGKNRKQHMSRVRNNGKSGLCGVCSHQD